MKVEFDDVLGEINEMIGASRTLERMYVERQDWTAAAHEQARVIALMGLKSGLKAKFKPAVIEDNRSCAEAMTLLRQ